MSFCDVSGFGHSGNPEMTPPTTHNSLYTFSSGIDLISVRRRWRGTCYAGPRLADTVFVPCKTKGRVRMRKLTALLVIVVLGVPCGASAGQPSTQLADLKAIGHIEKLMPLGDNKESDSIRQELKLLHDKLAATPVESRADVLNDAAAQTKWGTWQRYVVYYVCAWYGVNYTATKSYLTHAAFWWEWQIGPESSHPFSFDDVSVDLLYYLYEHNHDFQILHDILTTQSDAGTEEVIVCFTEEAIGKHPRGVLHVAELSAKGRDLVCKLLHVPPQDDDNPVSMLYGRESSCREFRACVRRVARDPKDPLSKLAADLLKPAPKRRK